MRCGWGITLKNLKEATMVDHKVIILNKNVDSSSVIYTIMHISKKIGFSSMDSTLVATAASELATNIIRYAGSGEINIYVYHCELEKMMGLELVAIDCGPGIVDVQKALEEHFTTTKNSLGLGLPSVKRIMDDFSVESSPGKGTTITASMWRKTIES